MNFFNDEIHEEMIALYRDFATGVCAPIAAEIDEEEKFPQDWTSSPMHSASRKYPRFALPQLSAFPLTHPFAPGRSTSSVPKSRRQSIFPSF